MLKTASFPLSNKIYIDRNVPPLELASKSILSITLYSGLSIDFSFFKIPHLELYSPSLTRFSGKKGFFIDKDQLPALDFRGFGLSTALVSFDQIKQLLKQRSSFKNQLVDFHYNNYVSIFNNKF